MTQVACPDVFIEQDRRALYSEGKTLEVRDDFCIIPFGLKEYPAYFQNDTSRWTSKKIGDRSRTQLVFDHPPRAGHPPAEQARQATLRVERRLMSHEYDETQLLLCSVLEPPKIAGPFIHIPPKGTLVVAKVFDPLFYTAVYDFTDERVDTVAQAGREIAHEGTAYKRLSEYSDKAAHPESTLIPGFQPKFYGFWHFLAKSEDPAFAERTLPVRLLLLEYVDGLSIAEMSRLKNDTLVPLDSTKQPISDPKTVALKDVDTNTNVEASNLFHWQRRLFIIDAVVDGLARQKHMGVDLAHACPIRPDQIIVEGGFDALTTAQPYSPGLGGNMANPRTVVVNYTRASTGKATAYKSLIWQKVPLPCSPIDHDSLRSLVRLRGWWPASLDKLSDQERAAFWPAWFARTFDSPAYIRRHVADPVLDEEMSKIDDVLEAEEEKVPARFRLRRVPAPEPPSLAIALEQERERAILAQFQEETDEAARVEREKWKREQAEMAERVKE